jgi:hypothetical protein
MNAELLAALQTQLDAVELPRRVDTHWRIFSFDEKTGVVKKVVAQPNIIPYQGADVMAKALSGDVTFAVAAVLFEYENTTGSIAIPTPARDEGIEYYLDTIPLTPNRDYLRVPLAAPVAFSSSDSAKYDNNQASFFAISAGTQGIHGEPFSSAANSKVFGVGLAATPVPDQYTRDKLFSRSYDGFDPVPKEDGYQIGAQYVIRFR